MFFPGMKISIYCDRNQHILSPYKLLRIAGILIKNDNIGLQSENTERKTKNKTKKPKNNSGEQ